MSETTEAFSLARYVAETAPGGLALVQGLLNTRGTSSGAIDLLDDVGTASEWMRHALAEWSARTGSSARAVTIDASNLAELRALRDRLRDYIAGERVGVDLDVPIAIVATPDGTLRTQPRGDGVVWVESAAWGAVLMAQELRTLPRLKLCRNELCGSAFYDRSKNSSGVWHDVHVCGNAANLRASRARRRAASTT